MDQPSEPSKPEKVGGYDKYEIENACETLLKAEMIKQDEKFMKVLQPYLDKKAKAAKAMAGSEPKKGLEALREKISKESESY